MRGGPAAQCENILRKKKQKKKPVNMSDSRQARADARLHSANHLLGERVKRD